jgi:hypothetical protein
MAELEQALYTYLQTQSGVTNLVSTRVHPLRLPQEVTLPAVSFQKISAERPHAMGADPGIVFARIQFDSWNTTLLATYSVAAALRTALSRYSGTHDSVVILDIFLEDEESVDEDQVDLFRVSQDYLVMHRE